MNLTMDSFTGWDSEHQCLKYWVPLFRSYESFTRYWRAHWQLHGILIRFLCRLDLPGMLLFQRFIFFPSSCSSFQTKKHFLRKNFVQSKYLFQESCLCSHSTLLCHQTSNPHCIRSCAETSYLQITISADKFTKSYLHLTENRCDKELKGCGEFGKQVGFKHR